MTLMLAFIVGFVVVGVASPRFEQRQELLVVGGAILMVLIYFFFSQRFM